MSDPNAAARWHAQIQMAIHLRLDHSMTWADLRVRFPGVGEHFWMIVRREVEA